MSLLKINENKLSRRILTEEKKEKTYSMLGQEDDYEIMDESF